MKCPTCQATIEGGCWVNEYGQHSLDMLSSRVCRHARAREKPCINPSAAYIVALDFPFAVESTTCYLK